ncbi:hypothetical protein ACFQE1_21865, partial [Halobium palmae]
MFETVIGLFWNRRERRFRAPWRLFGFLVLTAFAALLVGAVFLTEVVRGVLVGAGFGAGSASLFLNTTISAAATALAV